MRLRLTTRAYKELENISVYWEERNPNTAAALFAVFERMFDGLIAMPYRGTKTDIPEVRCVVIPRFPYKVFYRISGQTIEVLSIFHTSRNPREFE